MEQFLNIILNNGIGVGCAVAMLWLSWFRETKTIPKLIESFNNAHMGAMTAQASTQEMQQQHFDQRNEKSLETFSTLVREERQIYQRWHEENRGRLDKLSDEMKENRHLIKDLSNQMALRHAMEDKREEQRKKTVGAKLGGEA